MYRHVLSLLAGTMVAFALASTAPVTFAQDDLSEEGLEILPSEQIELQEYNLRLGGVVEPSEYRVAPGAPPGGFGGAPVAIDRRGAYHGVRVRIRAAVSTEYL